MKNIELIAWASPYDLPLIIYIGRNDESTEQIYGFAQTIISALPADEDFKALIYNTLSVGPRTECEAIIFAPGAVSPA
jgi:hypothetical protein